MGEVGVLVYVLVGVAVCVQGSGLQGVSVGDGVNVLVGVGVFVGVEVCVGVGVAVGGVPVGVSVGVLRSRGQSITLSVCIWASQIPGRLASRVRPMGCASGESLKSVPA